MLTEEIPAPVEPVTVNELKAFLRLESAAEDALLAAFLRSARAMCEAFTGRILIERGFIEVVAGGSDGRRLSARPVIRVDAVERVEPDGAATVLAADAWSVAIAPDGAGRVTGGAEGERLRVRYRAGLGPDWNAVPEALRQGILRLAAHFYSSRDAAGDPGPPAAVAALWRPWRLLRLA